MTVRDNRSHYTEYKGGERSAEVLNNHRQKTVGKTM
jgi:hypothetical protein